MLSNRIISYSIKECVGGMTEHPEYQSPFLDISSNHRSPEFHIPIKRFISRKKLNFLTTYYRLQRINPETKLREELQVLGYLGTWKNYLEFRGWRERFKKHFMVSSNEGKDVFE